MDEINIDDFIEAIHQNDANSITTGISSFYQMDFRRPDQDLLGYLSQKAPELSEFCDLLTKYTSTPESITPTEAAQLAESDITFFREHVCNSALRDIIGRGTIRSSSFEKWTDEHKEFVWCQSGVVHRSFLREVAAENRRDYHKSAMIIRRFHEAVLSSLEHDLRAAESVISLLYRRQSSQQCFLRFWQAGYQYAIGEQGVWIVHITEAD
ncbi:MAG: hypothetical protein KDA83_14580 [Planctomycetales bacterium]|nr:hypothetical protein [Planctomycetales bacterium]